MNTVAINIKTEPETKKNAQKVAKKLGLSLNTLINSFLHKLTEPIDEEPSEYLLKVMKKCFTFPSRIGASNCSPLMHS